MITGTIQHDVTFTATFIVSGQFVIYILGIQHFAGHKFFDNLKKFLNIIALLLGASNLF
jgi:hypothetical protein